MRTVFNILGPLTNPAGAKGQVVGGVFDKNLCEPIAYALAELGTEHALVVHGGDGMDEITNTGETYVAELKNGKVSTYTLTPPESLGMLRASPGDTKGGSPKENARDLLCIFKGQKGPKRDLIILNAAAALYVSGIVGVYQAGNSYCGRRNRQRQGNGKIQPVQDFYRRILSNR